MATAKERTALRFAELNALRTTISERTGKEMQSGLLEPQYAAAKEAGMMDEYRAAMEAWWDAQGDEHAEQQALAVPCGEIRRFDSTAEAYAETQIGENVKRGDILVVESEGVVGIADTWPFAITTACGDLHKLSTLVDQGRVLAHPLSLVFEASIKEAIAFINGEVEA